MKKKNLTALVAALALTVVASGSLLCGNGIVSYEGEMDETKNINESITQTNHCSNLSEAKFRSINVYNCFVGYSVMQENLYAMDVQFWRNPGDRAPTFSYRMEPFDLRWIFAAADEGSDAVCDPPYLYSKVVCPICGATSALKPIDYFAKYSSYYVVEKMKTSGTIQVKYDSSGWVWEHGLGMGDKIRFSVAYLGMAENGEVTVPLLGYSTDTVEINGVEFSVRTGPNRVSIKASTPVTCNQYNTMFGFSVEQ